MRTSSCEKKKVKLLGEEKKGGGAAREILQPKAARVALLEHQAALTASLVGSPASRRTPTHRLAAPFSLSLSLCIHLHFLSPLFTLWYLLSLLSSFCL